MDKKDREIQQKLEELEKTILKETESNPKVPSTVDQKLSLSTDKDDAPSRNDLYYFGGIGLTIFGVFQMFQYITIGESFMMRAMGFSGTGFSVFLIPLMVGIGWMIYNPKSKGPWILTAVMAGLIILTVITSLNMHFAQMNLNQLILLLLPLTAGLTFILKGMGGPKALEKKFKSLK